MEGAIRKERQDNYRQMVKVKYRHEENQHQQKKISEAIRQSDRSIFRRVSF